MEKGALDIFFYSILLVISVFDIRKQIIPDILVVVLAFSAFLYDVLTERTDIFYRFILAFSVFIVLYSVRCLMHGLGFGDVKLCSVVSYIAGFRVFIVSLFTACILGICAFVVLRLFKKEVRKIPFAPFVSAGFLAGKAVERFLL